MPYGVRQQLEDRITELIFELDLAPGEAMPPENQLVERLGAGRNSVREALRALHTRGIVDIRHGYGTFVGSAPLATMAPGLLFRTRQAVRGNPGALRELVAVRRALESGLIGDVVALGDPALCDRLDAEVAAMAAPGGTAGGEPAGAGDSGASDVGGAIRGGADVGRADGRGADDSGADAGANEPVRDTAAADRRFHLMLFEPLGNELATQLIELFWDAFQAVRGNLGPVGRPGDLVHRHADIVAALRAGDTDAARRAVLEHFDDVESRVAKLASES